MVEMVFALIYGDAGGTIMRVIQIPPIFKRCVLTRLTKSQEKTNELWRPEPIFVGELYANMLKTMCTHAPLLAPRTESHRGFYLLAAGADRVHSSQAVCVCVSVDAAPSASSTRRSGLSPTRSRRLRCSCSTCASTLPSSSGGAPRRS